MGVASSILISLLTPKPKQEGSRLDIDAPKSEYGYPLSQPYGKVRIDGCLCFWAPPLKEKKKKERQGKGGGPETTTYKYYLTGTAMIGLEIERIERVWLNGKLIYHYDPDDEIVRTPVYRPVSGSSGSGGTGTVFIGYAYSGGDEKSRNFAAHTEFYLGSDTQNPSPTIEAYEDGDIPAFRYRSYIVFKRYPVEEYEGSGFPKVDVEVIGKFGTNPKVKQIIGDVCLKAGLTSNQFDVSAIPDSYTVKGCELKNDGSPYRDLIEDLERVYFLISREINDIVFFMPQKRTELTAQIPLSALAARDFNEAKSPDLYLHTINHERELPSEVQVEFTNIDNDYDNGLQIARNSAAKHFNALSVKADIVADDSQMRTLASKILYQAIVQKSQYTKLSLLPAWSGVNVGDVITIPREDGVVAMQIKQKNTGTNYLIELECNEYVGLENKASAFHVFGTYYSKNYGSGEGCNALSYWRTLYPVDEPIDNSDITFVRDSDDSWFLVNNASLNQFVIAPVSSSVYINRDVDYTITLNSPFIVYRHHLAECLSQYGGVPGWGDTVQSTEIVAVSYEGDNYQLSGSLFAIEQTVEHPYKPQIIPPGYGSASIIPLDINLLDEADADNGLYIAVNGDASWRNGFLYAAYDGSNYEAASTLTSRSTVGIVTQPLDHTSANLIDDATVATVTLSSGELDPVTEDEFLAGSAIALFGKEIVAFQNAVQISSNPKVYEVSHLIRGCRGTEHEINNHVAGERFVLLTDYLERLEGRVTDVNRTLSFKAVATGRAETNVTDSTQLVVKGNSLRPYSVVNVRGDRNGSGDLTIAWIRRTRKNGYWLDYQDIGFADGELNNYDVEILQGETVKRTITVNNATETVYSASEQVTDFGSVQSQVSIRIYQLTSYPIGRGYPSLSTI